MLNALPDDPFKLPAVIGAWDTGIAWLNWFVPVTGILEIMALWCTATLSYYVGRYALEFFVNARH